MRKTLIPYAVFALMMVGLVVSSCKPETPPDPNEEELITKIQLTFAEVGNVSNTFTAVYSDPDGDGGATPVRFDSITLDSGKVYNVNISLLDESDPQDIVDITAEVQEEATDHLFCYTSSGPDVTVVRTDSDGTYEIGIQTRWTVGAPSNGTVRVELRHQPNVKDGSCSPGATDVQLDFVVNVI
jgi:hypothetical protein